MVAREAGGARDGKLILVMARAGELFASAGSDMSEALRITAK